MDLFKSCVNKERVFIEYLRQFNADSKYGEIQKHFEASSVEKLDRLIKDYIKQYGKALEMENISLGKILKRETIRRYTEYKESE